MTLSNKSIAYLIYGALVLIWGSAFILMKLGLRYYSPAQVASIRLLSASIALAGLAIFHIRKIPRNKLKYVLLSGVLGMFIPAYLFCYAEVGLSSAITGILNALTPFFTLFTGALFFRAPFRKKQALALAVGFIGILLLTLVNASNQFSLNMFAGFVILASLCYALNINIVKTYLSGINSLYISTVAVAFAGVLTVCFLMIRGGFAVLPINAENKIPLLASITLGLFATALAQILFNQVIRKTSAAFASSIIYALPIVAVGWGLLAGERLSAWHFLGMGLILLGIVMLRRSS